MLEWLLLIALCLFTRAIHCFLQYRANREGVVLQAAPTPQPAPDGAVLILNPQPMAFQPPLISIDPETQPSQAQTNKTRQRSPPRRRRTLSQTGQICGESC